MCSPLPPEPRWSMDSAAKALVSGKFSGRIFKRGTQVAHPLFLSLLVQRIEPFLYLFTPSFLHNMHFISFATSVLVSTAIVARGSPIPLQQRVGDRSLVERQFLAGNPFLKPVGHVQPADAPVSIPAAPPPIVGNPFLKPVAPVQPAAAPVGPVSIIKVAPVVERQFLGPVGQLQPAGATVPNPAPLLPTIPVVPASHTAQDSGVQAPDGLVSMTNIVPILERQFLAGNPFLKPVGHVQPAISPVPIPASPPPIIGNPFLKPVAPVQPAASPVGPISMIKVPPIVERQFLKPVGQLQPAGATVPNPAPLPPTIPVDPAKGLPLPPTMPVVAPIEFARDE
ncbi:hypothetical protein FB45DRAFT_1055868 [Roridomyces roridus]|uniref:Uncharacterized protein n=1 Tax=Roridomyces roridus TaxID=1738132 RepID=A0AAD7C0X6_9AGAR|nr:hypothetical protein FB45DRAFT_1055868 [Roridomyces roridus]